MIKEDAVNFEFKVSGPMKLPLDAADAEPLETRSLKRTLNVIEATEDEQKNANVMSSKRALTTKDTSEQDPNIYIYIYDVELLFGPSLAFLIVII